MFGPRVIPAGSRALQLLFYIQHPETIGVHLLVTCKHCFVFHPPVGDVARAQLPHNFSNKPRTQKFR
jgi:hypothetical protein